MIIFQNQSECLSQNLILVKSNTYNRMSTNSVFIAFVSCCLLACQHAQKEVEQLKFWYAQHHNYGNNDTLTLSQLRQNGSSKDSILISIDATIYDKTYRVNVHSNESYAPVDGELITLSVPEFGNIYYRAMTWRNITVLQSNNDSISNMIAYFIARGLQAESEFKLRHPSLKRQPKEIRFEPSKMDN